MASSPRQLGHSAQQLQDAREEKQKLLGALRRLVEDPEFPSERHLEVFDLLEEVSIEDEELLDSS